MLSRSAAISSSLDQQRPHASLLVVATSQRDVDTAAYWDDDNGDDGDDDGARGRYGYGSYDVAYDETLQEDTMEWERFPTDAGVVHVLLPPPTVLLPTTVIHFTGGTFFGSAPNLWYRQLLQDIVKNTQAVVVATSIPVTLLQSPLQHVKLAKKIQRQFETAWRDVLVDEYGDDLQTVPICGLGHSLGARLMVVMSTLGTAATTAKERKKRVVSPPPYKSSILISFSNYGASAGIPGISQLNKASRRIKEKEVHDGGRPKSRRRDDWLDDDDDDEDWGELFQELQGALREQAGWVKLALTPSSQQLELYPTPEQLWSALQEDRRYTIPETLVVQFDDDEIDQSSKLATALQQTSDVKFARVRGTHLTPVSVQNDQAGSADSRAWLQQINSRAGRILFALLKGRRQSGSNEVSLLELRQSIARYIIEVVTK